MNAGITQSFGTVSQASAGLRSLFLTKVYALLTAGLLTTVGVGAWIVSAGIMPPIGLLMIVSLVCIFGMYPARRVPGLNLLLFFVFTALEGAILGPLLAQISIAHPGVVTQTALVTLTVFAALTGYVFVSRKDFSFLAGFLFVGLIGMIVAGLVMMFFNIPMLSTLYAVCGVLLFSGYILFDTSQIINRLGPDDFVVGAIELYLDLINLFLYLLRLFSSRD